MANFYNAVIPRPAGIPETVEVRVFAGRLDGGDLTAEELAALREVFPALGGVVEAKEKPAARVRAAAGTKAKKPAPKRAAAKRPAGR
jgi:hypothetical protein